MKQTFIVNKFTGEIVRIINGSLTIQKLFAVARSLPVDYYVLKREGYPIIDMMDAIKFAKATN